MAELPSGTVRDRLAAARESTVQADPDGGPAGSHGCGAEQEAPPAQHGRASRRDDAALMTAEPSGT